MNDDYGMYFIHVFERDAVGEMGEVTGGAGIFDNLMFGLWQVLSVLVDRI
jgi:hypothetical protein